MAPRGCGVGRGSSQLSFSHLPTDFSAQTFRSPLSLRLGECTYTKQYKVYIGARMTGIYYRSGSLARHAPTGPAAQSQTRDPASGSRHAQRTAHTHAHSHPK